MSEQKDEFEDWCLDEISQYADYVENYDVPDCKIDENANCIYALQTALKKYQEIKAKKVCKNCIHLNHPNGFKYAKCLELTDMGFDDLYLNPEEIETFSCSRFQHAT